MLEDAGLHGTLDLERDPRHILLDALLLENNDFEGARQRYEWLSESDGPEQIFALDRLTALGASVLAVEALERIGQDLSRDDRSQLTDLKLKAALRSSSLATVSELIQSDSINVSDISEDHFAEFVKRTRVALSGDDINEKILALDIYNRFEANFENEELEPLAKSALVSVLGKTSEKTTTESDNEATYFANRPALVRQTLSSDTAKNFISDISKDLIEAEKILSDG